MTCLVLLVLCAGCFPATRVVRNPGCHDKGIRYYRPKPYLLVKPHVDRNLDVTDEFVDIEIQMLPDFSEEYSIHVRSGLGSNDTSIKLTDGWNLTALDVDVDSRIDENVRALTEGISRFVKSEGRDDAAAGRAVVRATNVPIGYYESIISRGHDGQKRMYGWRYIGFSPYACCPLEACGANGHRDGQGLELYGLVFRDGAMTFEPLELTRMADLRRQLPDKSGLDRALDKMRDEISRLVPDVLRDNRIEGVSSKDVKVTIDREEQFVLVQAALNDGQMTVWRNSAASNYDIASAISERVRETTGETIRVEFQAHRD